MNKDEIFSLLNTAVQDGDEAAADALCAKLKIWLDGGGAEPSDWHSRWETDENTVDYYDEYLSRKAVDTWI